MERKFRLHNSISLLVSQPINWGPWSLPCPSCREAIVRCIEIEVEGHQAVACAIMGSLMPGSEKGCGEWRGP